MPSSPFSATTGLSSTALRITRREHVRTIPWITRHFSYGVIQRKTLHCAIQPKPFSSAAILTAISGNGRTAEPSKARLRQAPIRRGTMSFAGSFAAGRAANCAVRRIPEAGGGR